MDIGLKHASANPVANPLPISWLGRADAPLTPPDWANMYRLSAVQIKNLQAQIGYDLSKWDYAFKGNNNELGRYQITPATLEKYGILAEGSNSYYGTDCVNYYTCWRPVTIRKNTNSYANYIYNSNNLTEFLTNTTAQDHLAYQIIYDLYNELSLINAITTEDTPEIVAGMISVAWLFGAGTKPSGKNMTGTGAYAWRYFNVGSCVDAYNSGRYAITVLSQ
ncbi:hypothetical protein UFOVP112_122 [uncultured Caudovirales phage]|uniref:Uncharacterized protein n=1 Tax=uncultured Caudovirales phage TaxID=2100421 RepID=A0A6J5LB36_9CAUD|nr:hypothetical protein UFOVP112_122 [uncultured Caudovirales phage]